MEKLAVIMPVYNEEEIVGTVVENWTEKLGELNIDYTFFIYNNESSDNTLQVLERVSENNPNIIIVNKKNEGHGPAVLKGYKDNARSFAWLFQIDSDNEMGTEEFQNFWEKRNEYDFLIAKRVNRVQNFSRKFVSLLSRLSIDFLFGHGVWDVNCPYRLMRSEAFIPLFEMLPKKTVSPNLAICGFAAKKKLKVYEYPAICSPRKTGRVSMQKWTLIKASILSLWQCFVFSFKI